MPITVQQIHIYELVRNRPQPSKNDYKLVLSLDGLVPI